MTDIAKELLEQQTTDSPAVRDSLGTVFIVPIDSPIPNALEGLAPASKTLLGRLAPLDSDPASYGVCMLAGVELFELAPVLSKLRSAKKVALLVDLPGARYDALMMSGAQRAGLQQVPWPMLAEAVEQRRRLEQRMADSPALAAQTGPDQEEVNDDDLGPI